MILENTKEILLLLITYGAYANKYVVGAEVCWNKNEPSFGDRDAVVIICFFSSLMFIFKYIINSMR